MFEKTSVKIVTLMENHKIIESEKFVITKWGIQHILNTLFNIFTFLIIGLFMNMIPETVIFTVGYIPLRSFAGGYHSKTPFRCWIVSNLILLSALLIVRHMSTLPTLFFIAVCIGILILILLMPVADMHKPLSDGDRKNYRDKGIFILIVEIFLAILFKKLTFISYSIASVWILLAFMLVLGTIKNKFLINQS